MINIAKLLKNCPEGTKLYSPLFGEVKFLSVDSADSTIIVETERETHEWFSPTGEYKVSKSHMPYSNAECLLFPRKDYRTWQGWTAPVEPKFKVGDWLVYKNGGTFCGDLKTVQVQTVEKDWYIFTHGTKSTQRFIDSECRLWTIQDAEDGDVLVSRTDNPFIYNGNIEFSCAGAYVGVSRDGRIMLDMFPSKSWTSIKDIKPATNEQRDLLFQKIKEIGYEWDKKKKELCKIIKPEFKVGDWVVIKNGGYFSSNNYAEQITLIENNEKGRYIWLSSKSWVDDDYIRLWTIQDAKDGDVITNGKLIVIFNKLEEPAYKQHVIAYIGLDLCGRLQITKGTWQLGIDKAMPATKEQRDLLFAKMKEAGYEWDAGKKELRKIIEPKFKVGDDIKTGNTIEIIAEVDHATRSYYCESGRTIYFANQDLWHLVPKPHYDIANFKPFDKVLGRNCCRSGVWRADLFSHIHKNGKLFVGIGYTWEQCIPYNDDTKHLLGTTNMCQEEYINW